jgi:hypothetical protein
MTNIQLEDTTKRPDAYPLYDINQHFHDQLEELRTSMRKKLDDGNIPVVVRLDSRLILALGDKRTILNVNDTYFHQLKAVAHLPIMLFLAARNNGDTAAISTEVQEALSQLQNGDCLPPSTLSIMQEAVTSLTDDSQWPILEFSAVRQYNEALQPAFQALITQAAKDEVEQTLKALHTLEALVDDDKRWKQTFYVICAGHQPRYKQLAKVLFRRWVFEATASSTEVEQRVLYGESLESVAAALELVATRLVNSDIGDAFLKSPLAMNQDVLGEAGEIAVNNAFSTEAQAIHP